MAAQPKTRAFKARLKDRGGDTYIWECMQNGDKMRAIASSLDISLGGLYTYLSRNPERHSAFLAARKLSAHAMADDALEIVDATEGEESPAAVRAAEIRANQRRWHAERANREDYGQPTQALTLNLNLASLHLTSLKATDNTALPLSHPVIANPPLLSIASVSE